MDCEKWMNSFDIKQYYYPIIHWIIILPICQEVFGILTNNYFFINFLFEFPSVWRLLHPLCSFFHPLFFAFFSPEISPLRMWSQPFSFMLYHTYLHEGTGKLRKLNSLKNDLAPSVSICRPRNKGGHPSKFWPSARLLDLDDRLELGTTHRTLLVLYKTNFFDIFKHFLILLILYEESTVVEPRLFDLIRSTSDNRKVWW